MSMRVNYPAVACLGAYAVYLMVFPQVSSGSNLFAPAPVASTSQAQWQQVAPMPSYVAQPSYATQQPAMLWQANSAQPLAYAPAYAPVPAQDESSTEAWLLACFAFGAAAGYGAHAALAVGGEEPTDKEKTIGAAGVGGILGVVLFGSLPGAVVLAAAGAYAATKSDAVKSAGGAAATVYTKAVDIEQEYDVLPKAKSAIDTVVTVADNLNQNYGLTDSIDKKLQLSERAESLKGKLDAQKDKLTSKVDELKEKSTSQ
jgi:hypothetical protein